jgi:methyl-accepting chemotaxis protein
MRQLNIGPRLALAFGLILLVLAGISLMSLARLADLNQKIERIVRHYYPMVGLTTTAFEGIKNSSVNLRNLLIVTDPEAARKERETLDASDAEVAKVLDKFSSRITADKARVIFKALMEMKGQYEADKAAYLDLLAKGDRDAARALLLGNLSTHLASYEQGIGQLNRLGGVLMNKSADEAADTYRNSLLLVSGLAIGALLLASAMAYWIGRGITVPLRRAVAIAETIATGNLASDIESGRTDETGRLLDALRTMNASLAKIVVGVRANAEAISDGAREIASGTIDLSTRTEQQASSLEETASSMEELTSTVKQSAGSAHDALNVARSAAAVAEKSGTQVRQVVDRMAAIEASSRKIEDIIGVIDGIAFQTNILALNAAVEAARAGELGRGFAVVASEVRNLAQRSAGAAREIKVLIEDSVGKIAAGNDHAREAGTTMGTVLSEIQRVAVLMNEIDAASREQTLGIDQINQAVAQMDHVTQQNASLVEEAAAAAESMQQRTEAMLASVQIFVLKGERPAMLALAR